MKYVFRCLAVALILALICCAAIVVMLLVSKRTADLYGARVKVSFNAATLNYVSGEPASTVIAEHGGQKYEVNPDNYRVVSFYVRQGAVRAYLPRALSDKDRLDLTICDTDKLSIYKLDADSAIAVFTTGGETMKMKIHVDGLWESLIASATSGDRDAPNLPIE